MAASSATAPLVTPAFDLEAGTDRVPESKEELQEEEEFPIHYYYIYGFSLAILIIGTLFFLLPLSHSSIVGSLLGIGGLITGVFLTVNADLVVTYMRLLRELQRFGEENENYKASLIMQKTKIKKVKEAEKALQRLESMCGGQMENLNGEMDEMAASSRDTTRRNIVGILIVLRPKQDDIQAGKALDAIIQTFSSIYVRAFTDIEKRFAEMHKGFNASPRWKKVQRLSVDRLKFVLTGSLFGDFKDISTDVTTIIEAETDGPAKESSGADDDWGHAAAFAAGRQEVKASAVQKEDSWPDAEAFATGRQQEKAPAAPAVQEEDPWADAMDFAGVS